MNDDIPTAVISVYTFSGRVFEYEIKARDAAGKAREHCDAIVRSGYRHTIEGRYGWNSYPRISKFTLSQR